MIEIGRYNQLVINRKESVGCYLIDVDSSEVLLPTKYVPTNANLEDSIEVFVYLDSEDRPIATTIKPFAVCDQFACLKVVDVGDVGAFLDWGLEKDLLVPYRQQDRKMKSGQWYLVYVYLDTLTNRLVATAKIHKFYEKEHIDLEEGQQVDLLVGETTVNGISVVIENKYQGLIYENEVFQQVLKGDRIKGFVKHIREDKKIDISLRKTGLENLESGAQKILDSLKENDGFLPLHDKSEPQHIQDWLQMSKKNFKRSLGTLYKKKMVVIEADGVRLTKV